jgi:hypothetical protein
MRIAINDFCASPHRVCVCDAVALNGAGNLKLMPSSEAVEGNFLL